MADILLGASNAKFRGPEVNIGPITEGGRSQSLAHGVGNSRAMELVLMGRTGMLSTPHQVRAEVNAGTITSGGGSQRLAHATGKSCAMELVLMERMWNAQEVTAWGMARMTRAFSVLMVMVFPFRVLTGDEFETIPYSEARA